MFIGVKELVAGLGGSDATSSILPLLIAIAILVAAFILALIQLILFLAKNRRLKFQTGSGATSKSAIESLALRERIQPKASGDSGASKHNSLADEIDALRKENSRLSAENATLHEMHGRAVRKIQEFQEAARVSERTIEEKTSHFEAGERRQTQLREKLTQLEGQLAQTLAECERVRREATAALESDAISEKLGHLLRGMRMNPMTGKPASQAFHFLPGESPYNAVLRLIEEQAREIARLNELGERYKSQMKRA